MPEKDSLAENLLRRFTRLTAAGATAKLALSIRDMADDEEQGIKVVPPLLREKAKAAGSLCSFYLPLLFMYV